MCNRISVKELPPVTPADAIKFLQSDVKDANDDGKSVPQDDILFLDKVKEGIQKNAHGHYEMPLTFKERPHLQKKKQSAIVRLSHI